MAVPRNRHSNARKNTRRAHHAKRARSTVSCDNCGSQHLPHHICPACGYYRGREVIQQTEEEES